ncbi:MAG: GNAT family N-acetyltransferase [Dehalococcoidia bacterium]|nr:GNAT family N-acetyltransferase [Dehalococcoidia bacterium]
MVDIMSITYRVLTEDDWDEWVATGALAFLDDVENAAAWAASVRPLLEWDRSLGAFDGDRMVGKTHAITFSMSVPGGDLPTAGVTAVSVASTHRRRGILAELMRRQLDDTRARGEPLAALWASESLIYGRFGYGMAVRSHRVSIDRRHTAFRPGVPDARGGVRFVEPDARGGVRFVEPDAALERWPLLYEQLRGSRPGMIARHPDHWRAFIVPRTEKPEGGFTRRQYVEYEAPDGPEGYAIYAAKGDSLEGLPRGTVRLHELVAANTTAAAALWRYLFGIDLVGTIEASNLPPDDPLLWMLADPRQLRSIPRDALWVRILDVPRALEGRAYLADGRLILDVRDPFGPWAAGRFELAVEGGKASCHPTDASPDVALGADDLAAVYLSGVRPSTLARAGRVEGSVEALRLADSLFAWHTAPWCLDAF